jgi:hypothetical protein
MKRFFLLLVLVMAVSWMVGHHRRPSGRAAATPRHWVGDRRERDDEAKRRIADETHHQTRRALAEARQALVEARDEVRQALDEARDEVHHALDEVRVSFTSDGHSSGSSPSVLADEKADGLPVPIVAGTRVTEAEVKPPGARNVAKAVATAGVAEATPEAVTGRLSATKDRAIADARTRLQEEISTWLAPEVPPSWKAPVRAVDALILAEPEIKTIQKDYGEVFQATLTVDHSPQRRTALVELFTRESVERRLVALGGTLAFILVCLAAVSSYIRADEATKGYYTNRLRMLAAAGVGASGVVIYHMIV